MERDFPRVTSHESPFSKLHEFFGRGWRRRNRFQRLRTAPIIDHGNLLDARDGAARRAVLLRKVFPPAIFGRIFFERHAWVSALLRAPVNESILADVEIA